MNALDLVTTTEWAMLQEPLERFLEIARDRAADRLAATLEARSGHADADRPEWCTWADREQEYRAVQLQGGGKLEGSRRAILRDGVALVPVLGPIFRRGNLMTELSGATSLEMIARDLAAAMASESVKAILLEVDSPGGQASGIAELAAHLVAMNRKKPIHAYIGGTGASAAYWLAAACGGITLSPTALVGSIGVLAAYQRDAEDEITIVSSQSPKKKPDLETAEGRAQIQQVLDDLAAVFVSDVARYRAVSEGTVLSDFGQGGVLVGRNAVRVGMADRLGSLESTLRALAQDPQSMCNRRKRAETDTDPTATGETAEDPQLQGEPPAGLPFEDELSALLAGVDGSIARARAIHGQRQQDGRSLSAARREQLAAVRERLDTLLRETEPRATEAARARLVLEAQAIEAELLANAVSGLLEG